MPAFGAYTALFEVLEIPGDMGMEDLVLGYVEMDEDSLKDHKKESVAKGAGRILLNAFISKIRMVPIKSRS